MDIRMKKEVYRTPVLISFFAASATRSSVSLFRVPNSSWSPYKPQAEY